MNHEEVYDSKISPLIKEINEICKEHKIPMLTFFSIESDEKPEASVTSMFTFDTNSVIEQRIKNAYKELRPYKAFSIAVATSNV